jgi:multidrug efflux system outer membrane protein
MKHRLSSVVAGLLLAGPLAACNVGPNYERPRVESPVSYRGQAAEPAPTSASLADHRWWQLFDDETLQVLIRTALEQNYDVRIAAARLLEAEAQLGLARADQLPTVSAGVSARGERNFTGSRGAAENDFRAELTASWEIDFWGKFRRASEAARADLLATEWGRRAAVQSLVAQVASAYFNLGALDQQRAIAEGALLARRESLRLTERREQSGAGSLIDVHQAQELVQLAEGESIDLARQIEQQENLLSTLLGVDPRPIARGRPFAAQALPPTVPAGLPSALLERRPDIQAAEQQLVSANAQVGVARADQFPSLELTGSGGVASNALVALFTSPVAFLSAAGSLVQPLFDGGRRSAQVDAADARAQQAELSYRSTILQALREVSDALVGFRRNRELALSREALVEASQRALTLVEARYQGGASSYLEVLDANSRRLDAELSQVRARLDVLLAYVEVYRALGGGWEV